MVAHFHKSHLII